MNYSHILQKIHNCEKAYINCYTKSYENKEIIRYRDDTIPDMHDHNFTFLKQITPLYTLQKSIEQELEIIQQENKDFIKLSMDTFPDERCFEGSYGKFELEHHGQYFYLPMHSPDWKTRAACEIQKISNSSMIDDLISMDINQDGERLGEDFCIRKARRRGLVYLSEAPLDCYICYYDGKPIGSCDLFIDNGTAKIEEFTVLPACQRQGFGTTILKYLIDTALFKGVDTIYLTADEDDTPKEMYLKFGFVKVDDSYALCQKLN